MVSAAASLLRQLNPVSRRGGRKEKKKNNLRTVKYGKNRASKYRTLPQGQSPRPWGVRESTAGSKVNTAGIFPGGRGDNPPGSHSPGTRFTHSKALWQESRTEGSTHVQIIQLSFGSKFSEMDRGGSLDPSTFPPNLETRRVLSTAHAPPSQEVPMETNSLGKVQ